MKDIDGDGKPDLVHVGPGGTLRYSKPDPAQPDRPVAVDHDQRAGIDAAVTALAPAISTATGVSTSSMPTAGGSSRRRDSSRSGPYHPQAFARWTGRASEGGAEMSVFDVNGDKLARRRDGAAGAWVRARLVRAEARCAPERSRSCST